MNTANESAPPVYVTTAIPYVNARPHLGFAFECVLADALARFHRQRGRDVRLVTGTDENSLKNVLAAEQASLSTASFVVQNAEHFARLRSVLDLSTDDFVRTSVDPRHRAAVEALWRACRDRGDLYRGVYRGLYCVGCEQFYEPEDLTDGRCAEHDAEPELVEEPNWFFRLSRYREQLLEGIASGRLSIQPDIAREQTLSFLRGGVRDISVSRSAARAKGWGIPVPGDPDQVIYVWFDALANYLAALGWGSQGPDYDRYWSGFGKRVHVIGKGITRFHTVFWPAFLTSAGLPWPTHVLVHGYLTVEGEKISKSGASVEVDPLVERFGVDALRYYLLREVSTVRDGDFRSDRFVEAYNAALANQLGNLVSRVLGLVERYRDGIVPAPRDSELGDVERQLVNLASTAPELAARAVERFDFPVALDAIFDVVAAANAYADRTEPWHLARTGSPDRFDTVLWHLVESVRFVGELLVPFLPSTAARIAERVGGVLTRRAPRWGLVGPGTRVQKGHALFLRVG